MVFDGLTWNTSPGAWEVEPPVSGSGPWSTTVTRSTPRAVSSSARLVPTTPAPMITTRGVVDMRAPGHSAVVVGRSDRVGSGGGAVLGRGVEQPGDQVSGERRAHHDLVVGAGVVEGHQHDAGLTEQGLHDGT